MKSHPLLSGPVAAATASLNGNPGGSVSHVPALAACLFLVLALATTGAAHPAAVSTLIDTGSGTGSSKSVVTGTIEKDAELEAPLCAGDVIRYVVTLTNTSPADTGPLDAAICDPIPPGTTYVDGSASGGGPVERPVGLCIYWEGQLAPDEAHTLSFSVTVDGAADSPIINRASGRLGGATGVVEYPLEIDCPATAECAIQVSGLVEDSAGNGTDRYPISNARVWLLDVENEPMPIKPLSDQPRTPTEEAKTNHTTEAKFDGIEFGRSHIAAERPQQAAYNFDLVRPILQEIETCPPRVIIASFLWDADNRFAVTSSNPIPNEDARFVPLYLARCISNDPDDLPPNGPCRKWEQKRPDHWVAEDVDFTFGHSPKSEESAAVIGDPRSPASSEDWDSASATQDELQRDGAHSYFFSYKAIEYMENIAADLELELDPVEVVMRDYLSDSDSDSDCDVTCTSSEPSAPFGQLGETNPPPDPIATVYINDVDSAPGDDDKPDNREWHELGHYWMLELYGGRWPAQPEEDNNSVNHGGYDNDTTWDSYIEGFAEFTSMLIAEYYGDPRPNAYRWDGSNSNLELDYRVWGSYMAIFDPAGNMTGFRSLTPDDEEFAVAGVLWDFHDGGDTDFANIREEKALGVVSNLIKTQDWLSLSPVEIFELIQLPEQPSTLKQLHSRFAEAHPLNSDAPDDFGDADEILIAHGAFDDVKRRNLRHDREEEPGLTGSIAPPEPSRPGRQSKPSIPNAYLMLRFIGVEGDEIDPREVTLKVRIAVDPPFEYYSYEYEVKPQSGRVYLVMPPNYFPSRAILTAMGNDGVASSPFILGSEEYWSRIDSDADIVAEHTFRLRENAEGCFSEVDRLCLNDGRFRIEVDWKDFQGNAGHGQVADLNSADSGLFYFFDPDNWEMLVKVLDGCGFNDHFWVFSAATTNVEYTLRVTDTATGATSEYFNPLGQAAPAITDTAAFATCTEGAGANARWVNLAAALGDGALVSSAASAGGEPAASAKRGTCLDSPERLCLDDGRFQVEAEWRDFQGNTGSARLVPFRAEDSGVFWFFDPDNWEMLVKVLDGCGFNDRFWVFSAATTNVEYTLRVTDTEAGVTREYFNPLGRAADALTDTDAFATCP
jgi:uncharacterized repeat protein (TIGR01451 family)